MAKQRKATRTHPLINNPLVRVAGHHYPASVILQQVAEQATTPLTVRLSPTPPLVDYMLIDSTLAVEPIAESAVTTAFPPSGVGYAAFTPTQRRALLEWLNHPEQPAAAAFQHFYVAHLEVGLLEPDRAGQVEQEVQRLLNTTTWHHHLGLARLQLLIYWFKQNGPGLTTWLAGAQVPGALLGLAIGQQALLGQKLQPDQLPYLFQHWSLEMAIQSGALRALRLSSLATTIGQEPLAYALGQLPAGAQQPQPWRTCHRDLRLAIPQADLRLALEPLLRDLASHDEDMLMLATIDENEDEVDENANRGWQLVLEFEESRSEFFALALMAAQKQPGYLALMDEDRHLIHRVHFQKGELRRFWRLWDYVQSWAGTKVYLNGNELSKWEVQGRLWQAR
ncbi:MAG: hypothetical protein KF832_09475 [Caldilineaceae bacterium]|nr:hypothetical protein [Caldilineaceae bacterium]